MTSARKLAEETWDELWAGKLRIVRLCSPKNRQRTILLRIAPLAMSPQQRTIAVGLLCGLTNKTLAYTLGLAQSTVATYAAQAAAKLGCSLHEMTMLIPTAFLGDPNTFDLDEVLRHGLPCPDKVVVKRAEMRRRYLTFPLLTELEPSALTEAERSVVRLLLEGKTNAQIAGVRGSSARTVANQLASAYRKLGCSGRRGIDPGLADLLLGGPMATEGSYETVEAVVAEVLQASIRLAETGDVGTTFAALQKVRDFLQDAAFLVSPPSDGDLSLREICIELAGVLMSAVALEDTPA